MAGLRPAAQSWSARRPSPHWPSLHTPALTWPPGSGIRPTQDSPAEPRPAAGATPPGRGRPASAPPRRPCRRDCSAAGQCPVTQQAPLGRAGPARPAGPCAETKAPADSEEARPGGPGPVRPAGHAGRRQGRLRLCLSAPGGRHQVPWRGCRLRVSMPQAAAAGGAGRLPSLVGSLGGRLRNEPFPRVVPREPIVHFAWERFLRVHPTEEMARAGIEIIESDPAGASSDYQPELSVASLFMVIGY